nr:MAG TPA: hypothetical protein [Caudoviricetes sp.]
MFRLLLAHLQGFLVPQWYSHPIFRKHYPLI